MVLWLGRDDRSEVVDVLSGAFADYPVMRYVLSDADTEYHQMLELLVGVFVDLRLLRGSPVLGIRLDGSLVAAALVDEPSPTPIATSPLDAEAPVWKTLGEPAYRRMIEFERKSAHLEPEVPHYFVGMIGVRDRLRGRGFARRLLAEVERMSAQDPGSTAVSLSTEQESNLAFYHRLGYRVTGEAQVGDLRTWNLMLETG